MSPEQARGKTVDRRTDIWAFGCVLFEMLTGSQVFAGATVTDVLAAVVMKEPEWSLLPPKTHPSIKKLLQRCLDKDPKRRLRDIGEARIEIEQAIGGTAEPAPAATIATATSSRRELAAWVAVGILALVAGGLGVRAWLTPNSPGAPAVVSQILPPPTETFVLGGYASGPPDFSRRQQAGIFGDRC
jgi:hypothetical protein